MRIAIVLLALGAVIAGCASDAGTRIAGCTGFEPGSEGWVACRDGGGVAIATGPGSPYHYRDLED